jgi:site-specific DNA-methyltransferase (adenine-specific)
MDENSIDSIVTDPPAGIAFMNREWDRNKGGRDQWIEWMADIATECYRVIKPGGYALVWALPRTSHWTATAWEDGGFEVRDSIVHIFGSGFPKSLNISKALDATVGAEREVVGTTKGKGGENLNSLSRLTGNDNIDAKGCGAYGQGAKQITIDIPITAPTTDIAKIFDGYGTALKPAHEDWILLREPLEGTVAQNVLKWCVGGINIDGCRVETNPAVDDPRLGGKGDWSSDKMAKNVYEGGYAGERVGSSPLGRFPANLIHDGSEDVLQFFPNTKSGKMMPTHIENGYQKNCYGKRMDHMTMETYGDFGSAARFFYCAKPSKSERNIGCENLPQKTAGECTDRVEGSAGLNSPRAGAGRTNGSKNDHPTVKSISLMRYLCKLITPPNGIVLDLFCGSGSTGLAAYLEGFQCIMIDSDPHSCEIAEARMKGIIKENSKLS